jgi:hypothetical protein
MPMSTEPWTESPAGSPIDGRSAFTLALREAAAHAVRARERELCLVDPDFESWPLDDSPWLDALTRWARLPDRRLIMVASRFDTLPVRCARFCTWRGTYAHVVQAFATEVEFSQVPTLMLAGAASLTLPDRLRWRGARLSTDKEVADWREVVDALLQRSEPGFAANLMGL